MFLLGLCVHVLIPSRKIETFNGSCTYCTTFLNLQKAFHPLLPKFSTVDSMYMYSSLMLCTLCVLLRTCHKCVDILSMTSVYYMNTPTNAVHTLCILVYWYRWNFEKRIEERRGRRREACMLMFCVSVCYMLLQ